MDIFFNSRDFYTYLLSAAWGTQEIRGMFEAETAYAPLALCATRLDTMKYRFRFFAWARRRYGIPA